MSLGVMASGTTYTLSGGAEMPQVGLGVYQSDPGEQTYNAVRWALELGYRLVDTVMCSLVFVLCTYLASGRAQQAAMYGNEADVGRAIRDSGVPRNEV